MRAALLCILLLLLISCNEVHSPKETIEIDTYERPNDTITEKSIPKPKLYKNPDIIEPLKCQNITYMHTVTPHNIRKHTAITITSGTDDTKLGTHELGYLLPNNLFIRDQSPPEPKAIAIKAKGPKSSYITTLNLTVTCDNQNRTFHLPDMTNHLVFYVDTQNRLYFRDANHDGTGKGLHPALALTKEHQLRTHLPQDP